MSTVTKEYNVHLDTKNRVTIRKPGAEYFAVKQFSDGSVLLQPRVLVHPDAISKRTLKMLDTAAKNFKEGKVSEPIDLDKYL